MANFIATILLSPQFSFSRVSDRPQRGIFRRTSAFDGYVQTE